MENPYAEMSFEAREQHLIEIEAEWKDYCNRRAELDRWGDTVQRHRTMLLTCMGVTVLPVGAEA